MNVDQLPPTSSSSRTTTNTFHDQHVIPEERQIEHRDERHVPDSYRHSSYEYLSSSHVGGDIHPQYHPHPHHHQHHHRPSSPSQKNHMPASYSPTSYHYQPSSLLDEPSATNSYPTQRLNQQPISASSLSAYVPQVSNPNRHSLLPTTSEDSGNESSANYHQQLTTAPTNQTHFVVVAIDFGTTFSGYAFAFTRDIDSILMMRKVDGNDPG